MKIFKNKLFMSLMSVLLVIVLAIGITFSCVDLSHKNEEGSLSTTTYDDFWYSSVKNSGFYSLSGSGTEEDPYLIGSPEDLATLAIIVGEDGDVNGEATFENACHADICCGDQYFRQTCDIDLSGYYWAPIGGGTIGDVRAFGGHYDGGGHSITNVIFSEDKIFQSYGVPFPEEGGIGLFGIVAGSDAGEFTASIKRLKVSGAITSAGTPSATGGLVGRARNAEISECNFSGSVSGDNCSGGLVGLADNCLLINCYNSSKVVGGACVGGLVGQANDGIQISFCYNKGFFDETSFSVEGGAYVGGLVGGFSYTAEGNTFSFINCFNDATIKAGNVVGGLVGGIEVADCVFQFKNCFNISGTSDITRSVIVDEGWVGGLIGEILYNGTFEMANCFSGCNIAYGGSSIVGSLIGYVEPYANLHVECQDLKVYNELYEQLNICGEASLETADQIYADPDDGNYFNFRAQELSWYEDTNVWIDFGDGNDYVWRINTIWQTDSGNNDGYATLAVQGYLIIELDYQGEKANSFPGIFPGEYLNYYYYDSNTYIDFDPAKNGYTFLGYADSPDSPSIWYYTTTGGSTSPIEEEMTIYAVWQGNTYTVTLDRDGGTGGTTSISIQYDTLDATISSLPTKTGLVFDGYYTQKNGQGVKYFDENGKCLRLWDISSNTTLYANYVENNWTTHADTAFATGSGDGSTATKAILIEAPNQLALLAKNVNAGTNYSGKYFKLTSNIDLAKYEWVPIGISTNAFQGKFDGDNYTISGLRVNGNYQYVGLFGYANSSATVSNVNINDSILISTYTGTNYVGGIVAYGNITITNCACYAVLQGHTVGGVCGNSSASISECKFTGRIIGTNDCGGIVGSMRGGTISKCINYGDIEGSTVGGIAGSFLGGTLRNCISKGTVKSSEYVGSIVGTAYYAGSGTPALYDCAGYGIIYATDKAKAGAICGKFAGYASAGYFATIKNCSFVGTCNIDIGVFCGESESINISSSYSQINGKGYYTDGDFSGFTIVENMNNNLPMQNALYSIAIGGQTSSYIIGKLTEKGYEFVA